MESIVYHPIGWVRSPYQDPGEAPPQSYLRQGVTATIILRPEYVEGLSGLAAGDWVAVLFHFHRAQGFKMLTKTPWDDDLHGLFTTRSPRRPNPIGLSVVQVVAIDGGEVTIDSVDMLDGTPVLDLKIWRPGMAP